MPAPQTVVDLRSDTVTRPTPAMRDAMAEAIVGDDQFGEDPTVNLLETTAATLMGKEAAIYVSSGIMGNLTSLLAHCGRGDEAIVGSDAHIYRYEHNGASTLGGVSWAIVDNREDGTLDVGAIESAIRPKGPGIQTGVVCLENTHNRCGGAVLTAEYMRMVKDVAHAHSLPVHLDGARVFYAARALGVPVAKITAEVDTVQFCLSKGLAAPVGSMVAGPAELIARVRHYRKVIGGAMRQSGVIAAAGLVALEHMVERLSDDHTRASSLANGLAGIDGVIIDPARAQSNIVVFRVDGLGDHAPFLSELSERGVRAANFGDRGVRMVTHYEITDEDIAQALDVVRQVASHHAGGR